MLTINYNGTDLSLKLEEFTLPAYAITLLTTEKIYIGYRKPINNFYVELNNIVDSQSILSVKYNSNSGLKEVSNLFDKTNGFGNSGRIFWDLPGDSVASLMFGKTLHWYELSIDVDTEERSFVGINVLFSDDNDLSEEYPGIIDELPEEATSFVNFHASAKKEIIQKLRKIHVLKDRLLDAYDLLNNEEVHQASKYLALSKVMTWLSENENDKWAAKAPGHYGRFIDFMNGVEITVDSNDDGKVDDDEKPLGVSFVKLVRV